MKKTAIYIILSLLSVTVVQAADTEQLIEKSRAAIKTLASELKNTLQTSMQSKGPVDSIAVCQLQAPTITRQASTQNVLRVARTSLKYRNQNNKPDVWERSVLEQFEKRKKNGEKVSSLTFSELTEKQGKTVFRYMKAIPTAEVCLTCHGDNIPLPVARKINELYPQDKATGFHIGDIRGAFTVSQEIE